MNRFLLVFSFLTNCAFAQEPADVGANPVRLNITQPDLFLNHPSGLNNSPSYKLIELDEAETRRYLIRRYFGELSLRFVFRDPESVKAEFGLPTAIARDLLELYRQSMAEIEQYVTQSIREPCAMVTASQSSLKQWASSYNARSGNVSGLYEQLVERIDFDISSDAAGQIRDGIDELLLTGPLPIRRFDVNIDANDADLLQAFNQICHTADVPAF